MPVSVKTTLLLCEPWPCDPAAETERDTEGEREREKEREREGGREGEREGEKVGKTAIRKCQGRPAGERTQSGATREGLSR